MRSPESRSSNSPSFFQSKACHCAGFAFFLSSPAGLCRRARSFRRAGCAVYFPLFPTSALRCPSSGRTNGRFSKKPPDNSEKHGAIGENTGAFPAYSTVYRLFLHGCATHPRVFTELPDAREHRVSILCINSAALSLFPSVGKIWAGIFHSHSYILSHQFHNKVFSTTNMS